MSLKFAFTVFFLTFFFFSCTKEVNIDIPGYQEQLVVDGRIETDCFPIVMLSKSQNIYAGTDLASYLQSFIEDAQVKVSDGSQSFDLQLMYVSELPEESQKILAEMLDLEFNEVFFFPIPVYSTIDEGAKGSLNKTYTLTINHNGINYSGETTLLPPVPLTELWFEPESSNPDYSFLYAKLSDPPNQYNAYKWEAKRINIQANGEELDTLFRTHINAYFDDQFFDGVTFDFATPNRQKRKNPNLLSEYKRYYHVGDSAVVKFSRMDRKVFDFFEKKAEQVNSFGNPFSTPVNIPSNISGALGIWAGFSPYYDTVYFTP